MNFIWRNLNMILDVEIFEIQILIRDTNAKEEW